MKVNSSKEELSSMKGTKYQHVYNLNAEYGSNVFCFPFFSSSVNVKHKNCDEFPLNTVELRTKYSNAHANYVHYTVQIRIYGCDLLLFSFA